MICLQKNPEVNQLPVHRELQRICIMHLLNQWEGWVGTYLAFGQGWGFIHMDGGQFDL